MIAAHVVCDKVFGQPNEYTNVFVCVDREAARFMRNVRNGFGQSSKAVAGVAKLQRGGGFKIAWLHRS